MLPYSYGPRQIGIVTTKSISRQFSAGVILDGRPRRDKYWKGNAIEQKFLEEDMASCEWTGASKIREDFDAPDDSNIPAMSTNVKFMTGTTLLILKRPAIQK